MSIIQEQSIYLNDQFEEIKEKIVTKDAFSNLRIICAFCEKEKSITFKTEKIHPFKIKKDTKPVLLLFSNPHPISVQTGMYFSEPHSQAFWERLFACNCMRPQKELLNSVSHWSNETINILSNCLLYPEYSDKITLFFDCLEPLPTNQFLDLNIIFSGKKGRELRKTSSQDPGIEHLHCISKINKITSWVVFSVQAYRNILGDKDIAKHAPKKIKSALDQYQLTKNTSQFWKLLKDLKRTLKINDLKITVYLALIARHKNDLTSNGERYFTLMLDQIFQDITKQKIENI